VNVTFLFGFRHFDPLPILYYNVLVVKFNVIYLVDFYDYCYDLITGLYKFQNENSDAIILIEPSKKYRD